MALFRRKKRKESASEEIQRLGEETSAQADSILVHLRRKNRKKRLAEKKLNKEEERALESAGAVRRRPRTKK